jgi:hypothetical protein
MRRLEVRSRSDRSVSDRLRHPLDRALVNWYRASSRDVRCLAKSGHQGSGARCSHRPEHAVPNMTVNVTIQLTTGPIDRWPNQNCDAPKRAAAQKTCDAYMQHEFYGWIYASVMRESAGLGDDASRWHTPGMGKLVSSRTNHTAAPELAKPALRQPPAPGQPPAFGQPKVRMD